MALDTTLLKPAQIGTSEIATKNDITTSLGAYNPATVINTNTTTIDGGKITTGTVTTSQLNATDIKTGSIFVDNTLRSSDFTTIGGTGFRLKSNAAGTSADPTIYGAYIKGAFLDGAIANPQSMKITATGYPNNYGRVFYMTAHNTTITSNATVVVADIVGPSYSSGLANNRVCDSMYSIVTIEAHAGIMNPGGVAIQRSVDGGTWATLWNMPGGLFASTMYTDNSLPAAFATASYRVVVSHTSTYNNYLYSFILQIHNV